MAVDLTQPIKLGSPEYVEQQVIRKLDALGTSVTDPALEARVAQNESDIAALVSDDTYGAGWNGVTDVAPSKNAVYDKIEAVIAAGDAADAVQDGRLDVLEGVITSFTLETPLQNDDTVYSYSFGTDRIGSLIITTNVSGEFAILGFRARTSSAFCYVITASSDFTATTGVLSGTTGTDTKSTVSVHTNNTLYVENRRGTPRQYAVAVNYRS